MSEYSWMMERLKEFGSRHFWLSEGGDATYSDFMTLIHKQSQFIKDNEFAKGECIALIGDYSLELVSMFMALVLNKNIIVPLPSSNAADFNDKLKTSEASIVIMLDSSRNWIVERNESKLSHQLLIQMKNQECAGLILFSSGTTGQSKAALQSIDPIIGRFKGYRKESYRTLIFLKIDHIGGINTLFSIMLNGGTIVVSRDRSVDVVCSAIERNCVELLPTTPTFLNMLIMSQAHKVYNLESLKFITYGTEPMPLSTLKAVNCIIPHAKLKQTFGLTELGIFSTKSRDSTSNWMKIGGEDIQTRIINNILHIKTNGAMQGYLNAPSPFDSEGWFNTGDLVEEEDGYIRILGREKEVINVGGEKVLPTEVENVILEIKNVKDVLVRAKHSPVTGQIVEAIVVIDNLEGLSQDDIRAQIISHCRQRLETYKVPLSIKLTDNNLHNDRFKKKRILSN